MCKCLPQHPWVISAVFIWMLLREPVLSQISRSYGPLCKYTLHNLTPSPTSLNKRLQWVSEGFSAPAKHNYITRSTQKIWTDVIGNRLSEDRWGHTLSACQDLPFPVRLKLPPSQSASVLQLCLPGSCYKQDTGVSLCTQVRKEDMKKTTGKQPGNVKERSCFYSVTCMDPTRTALWAIRL